MKIAPQSVNQFILNGFRDAKAALLYGPNAGLNYLRKNQLLEAAKKLFPDADIQKYHYSDLKKQPEILAMEIKTNSLFASSKVILIESIATSFDKDLLQIMLDAPNNVKIILVAAELAPSSVLRKKFESEPSFASIAAYNADEQQMSQFVRQYLNQLEFAIESDALKFFIDNIGNDQLIAKNELDKLVLATDDQKITLSMVHELLINNEQFDLENFAIIVASKNYSAAMHAAQIMQYAGTSVIALTRAMSRYYMRLLTALHYIEQGSDARQAMQKLKPAVFFKVQPIFLQHLSNFYREDLVEKIKKLTILEISCKKGIVDMRVLFAKTLHELLT